MRWLALLLPLFLMNCTAEQWKRSFNSPPLVLSYDDFGPESSAVGLLGTRGPENQPVTVHQGGTRLTPGDLRVNMLQAMSHLRFAVRRLPRTAEAQPLREKLRATYSRIYPSYRTRRDAMMSAPFSTIGRGSINRAMILPPMPPSI